MISLTDPTPDADVTVIEHPYVAFGASAQFPVEALRLIQAGTTAPHQTPVQPAGAFALQAMAEVSGSGGAPERLMRGHGAEIATASLWPWSRMATPAWLTGGDFGKCLASTIRNVRKNSLDSG